MCVYAKSKPRECYRVKRERWGQNVKDEKVFFVLREILNVTMNIQKGENFITVKRKK